MITCKMFYNIIVYKSKANPIMSDAFGIEHILQMNRLCVSNEVFFFSLLLSCFCIDDNKYIRKITPRWLLRIVEMIGYQFTSELN